MSKFDEFWSKITEDFSMSDEEKFAAQDGWNAAIDEAKKHTGYIDFDYGQLRMEELKVKP